MFIRTKKIGKRVKFYLVENAREGGKVKQKVLAYLGENETVEAAIAQLERWIEHDSRPDAKARHAARLQKLESVVPKNDTHGTQI
jgi:methionine salvage enolase-phosphatase E1